MLELEPVPTGYKSAREAAAELGLSPRTVSNYLGMGVIEGELVYVRGQSMWAVSQDEIRRYRQERDARRAQQAYNRARRAESPQEPSHAG